ncbi:ImmA/IrrE family metallo-endopeptidase [Saccharopolyspora shandongensis]|uniref:ImmA/IrrE family metallo-endopeptidase n=1 Tax=Saccharopolyspora shandongensis TaxID=418495 RepID=UPI003407006A
MVFEEDFGTQRVDGLSQWIGDHPVLLINKACPTDRRRLTMAHELGHIVLHNGLATDDPEREANEFAAEFLMPSHVIKAELRSLTLGKLQDLKQVWGTSMQSLYERAYSLVKYIGKTLQSRGLSTQEIAEITGFDSSEDTNPFLPAPTHRHLSAV